MLCQACNQNRGQSKFPKGPTWWTAGVAAWGAWQAWLARPSSGRLLPPGSGTPPGMRTPDGLPAMGWLPFIACRTTPTKVRPSESTGTGRAVAQAPADMSSLTVDNQGFAKSAWEVGVQLVAQEADQWLLVQLMDGLDQ